jgi:hypothetical protein
MLAGILSPFVGVLLGLSRSHARSHFAVMFLSSASGFVGGIGVGRGF